jgi:hypothetical protein
MTVQGSDVKIGLLGYGTATVDWGNGSTTNELNNDRRTSYEWKYSQESQHTIKITGGNIQGMACGKKLTKLDVSKNTALTWLHCGQNQLTSLNVKGATALTSLECHDNQLTSLNVSKCTALTELRCWDNKLTSLDVSKNTVLNDLDCSGNQFSAKSLNALFRTLHSNAGNKTIYIGSNPGTNDCDRSIATNKGWEVK